MIRSVEIKRVRGIEEGNLGELSALTVLVGPNGSGKSTVIEAILLAGPLPSEALKQIILRHQAGGTSARWFLWKGREGAQITLRADPGIVRDCSLNLDPSVPEHQARILFRITNKPGPSEAGVVHTAGPTITGVSNSSFQPLDELREVRLVDSYVAPLQKPLYDLFSKAVQQGKRNEIRGIIQEVFPRVLDIEILTEAGSPILHFVFDDYSVPATLTGDGFQSLLRLSLELADSAQGVALLEEPEVHQHPAAIRQSARAILAAVRRDIQVVITTHSLELIDALVAAAAPTDVEKLSVYQLRLDKGKLVSHRRSGPEVAFARAEIERDLR